MAATVTEEMRVTLPLSVLQEIIRQLPAEQLDVVRQTAEAVLEERLGGSVKLPAPAPGVKLTPEMLRAAERALRGHIEMEATREQRRAQSARLMESMGIDPNMVPIPVEELQEQLLASGINPEDNEFSREIIRMREE